VRLHPLAPPGQAAATSGPGSVQPAFGQPKALARLRTTTH
jgi:hypothetical protein